MSVPIVHRAFPGRFAERTVKAHLLSLRKAGLLKATRDGVNQRLVYSCTAKGVRFLREQFDKPLLDTREEMTRPWIFAHELGLSEFQTDVRLIAHNRPDLSIAFYERRHFHDSLKLRYRDPLDGSFGAVKPDLSFLVNVERNGTSHKLLHFVEYDLGSEEPGVFLAKLQAYDTWFADGGGEYLRRLYAEHGAADPRAFYRRLVVTRARPGKDKDDATRLAKLFAQALRLPEQTRNNIFVTTGELLDATRDATPYGDASIWFPVRLARTWQRRMDALSDGRPNREHNRRVYEFVAERLAGMKRLSLFPPAA